MPVITIPLNTGMHEEIDQRLMTDGRLRTVRNGRLDREGRIRVRAGYTAVDERVVNRSGQNLIAYDLCTYRGRMVVLGDTSDAPVGYATNLFDWIDGARPWRAVMPSEQKLPRLTGFTELVGSTGSNNISVQAAAACNDRLLLAYGGSSDFAVVMVQPSTGKVLFIDDLDEGSGRDALNPTMCETDAKIIVVGRATGSRFLYGYVLDETTRFMADGDIATALIDAGGGNTVVDWALARVAGSEQFVIVAELSTGAVVTRRYDTTGTVIVPSGGQYADITANPTELAIEADSVSNTVNVAMTVGGQVRLTTFNLTTGAEVGVGPHTSANMGAATAASTGLYLVRASATSVIVVANITDATAAKVGLESYNPATNAFATTTTTYLEDAVLNAQPSYHDGETVVAIRHDVTAGVKEGPVLVLSVELSAAANDVTLLASIDLDLWGNARGRFFEDPVTGKWYWNRITLSGTVNDQFRAVVAQFDLDDPGRRQMVESGNLLYISGGLPLVYDGVSCVEMSFADHPRFIGAITPSNGAGTLDNDATYTYGMHYQSLDARGNVVFSSVANPAEVTMGAAEDTNALTISRPYSLRSNLGSDSWLGGISTLVFRNTSELVDGNPTPSDLLQWTANTNTGTAASPQGDPDTFTDLIPDSTVETEPVIYTQAQTILDNRPAGPCHLMGFDGTRMIVNAEKSEQFKASKPLQVGEEIAFARDGTLAFQGSLSSDIEAIITFAQSWLFVTRRELWSLNGQGPNINGVGEFQSPYRVPSDGGMREGGWTSVCVLGKGVLFQLEDDQFYLWNGGAPEPVGLEIQDTLEEFPNVVAACHVTSQQAVALALQNDDGDDGCIVVWDQQSGQWFRDDVGAVTSMCEHDGKLAFIRAGVVYLEDDDYGSGVAVPLTLATGNVAKNGVAGASGIQLIHLVGVFQDECTAEMRIKYHDESTFTSLGVQTLDTASGYAVDSPFDLEWQPPRDDGSRYELELVVTSSAQNTRMAWLNAIEVHYDIDNGPTRVGDARRR